MREEMSLSRAILTARNPQDHDEQERGEAWALLRSKARQVAKSNMTLAKDRLEHAQRIIDWESRQIMMEGE